MNKVNIHWICPEATPYHDYFFKHLNRDDNINLNVHYMNFQISRHPWKNVELGDYKYRKFETSFGIEWTLIKLAMCKQNKFVINGWHKMSLVVLIFILYFLKRPFAFFSDTPKLHIKRSPLKKLIRSIVANIVMKGAIKIMTTGKPGIEGWEKEGCPIEKLVNFPFFVDLETIKPVFSEKGKSEDNNKILFVSIGILDNKLKCFDIGLEAIAKAREITGKEAFEYYIAGVGPDEKKLRERTEMLNLERQTKFLGWLETNEIIALLQKCDVLIHPARYDPFPVVVLEAMAAGLVVLGSDTTGAVIDRIVHGENGFIHKTGNMNELAGQIASIIEDPSKVLIMGKRARQNAEKWPASRGVEIVKSIFQV